VCVCVCVCVCERERERESWRETRVLSTAKPICSMAAPYAASQVHPCQTVDLLGHPPPKGTLLPANLAQSFL